VDLCFFASAGRLVEISKSTLVGERNKLKFLGIHENPVLLSAKQGYIHSWDAVQ